MLFLYQWEEIKKEAFCLSDYSIESLYQEYYDFDNNLPERYN